MIKEQGKDMNENIQQHNFSLSGYLYILIKWMRFLIINLLIVVAISTGIAFLIIKEYKATSTIMIPPDMQSGLGGLTGLLGGKTSIAALGSKMFGMSSNSSEDVMLGIMNSRTALTKVINEFDLMKYYDINDGNIDKALKELKGDFSTNSNEYGMIEVSVINKDPNVAADIANYFIRIADSLNIIYNSERAKNNRMFLEKRYLKNIEDLKIAEEGLYRFQKKYGIVAVPEQLEVAVKAAAEIEGMLTKKELEAYLLKGQYGDNSPQYQGVAAEVTLLKKKVQELKSSSDLGLTSNVFFAFKQLPDIAIQYLRTYREVQIQQSILEIVMPMYEQAKVEEQKSVPAVMVIDKAVPPQLKHSPKRAVIIVGIFFLVLFILIPFVFISEKAVQREKYDNPLQERLALFVRSIKKTYKLKN
jgi:Capsule polysaccharide export protein